jgi:hypothetical protein
MRQGSGLTIYLAGAIVIDPLSDCAVTRVFRGDE